MVSGLALSQTALLAVLAGATAGGGLFLLAVAVRGLPPGPPGQAGRGWARVRQRLRELAGLRGAAALAAGIVAPIAPGRRGAAAGGAVLGFRWGGGARAAPERPPPCRR